MFDKTSAVIGLMFGGVLGLAVGAGFIMLGNHDALSYTVELRHTRDMCGLINQVDKAECALVWEWVPPVERGAE